MAEELVEAGFKPREKRYDLESLEGGWIRLRRMDHGHANELTDIRLSFVQEEKAEGGGKATISTKAGRQFSFEHAVVDHNLSSGGKKCDFKNPKDVDALDPVCGDEIANLIEQHQELVEEADLPNSEAS